jgi:hypothetical protein
LHYGAHGVSGRRFMSENALPDEDFQWIPVEARRPELGSRSGSMVAAKRLGLLGFTYP